VEVSSGEGDVSKTDTSVDKLRAPAGDDAEDWGVSLVELIAPNQVSSDVPEQVNPSIAD
jgi:hypothetical protein